MKPRFFLCFVIALALASAAAAAPLAPALRSTAMGLITLAELKQPMSEQGPAIARYFDRNAKAIPDIYIAEAALYAAGLQPLNPRAWLEAFEATRSADGSYGKTVADT